MKTFREFNESVGPMTKKQLDILRKKFSTLETVNPMSPAWKKIEKLLDTFSVEALIAVRDAKPPIKFLSHAANTRLRLNHGIKD